MKDRFIKHIGSLPGISFTRSVVNPAGGQGTKRFFVELFVHTVKKKMTQHIHRWMHLKNLEKKSNIYSISHKYKKI